MSENTTLEYLRREVLPKGVQIRDQRNLIDCRRVNLAEDYTIAIIRLMEAAMYYLAFVPRKVDYNGFDFRAEEVYAYDPDAQRLQNSGHCIWNEGEHCWVRIPN